MEKIEVWEGIGVMREIRERERNRVMEEKVEEEYSGCQSFI